MRGANAQITQRARSLRRSDNAAEALLWSELRNRRLGGFKFVRQEPIGRYVADFACRDRRLVVELDGSQHAGAAHDIRRDAAMTCSGWSVARFWSHEVFTARTAILETILAICDGRLRARVEAMDFRFYPAE